VHAATPVVEIQVPPALEHSSPVLASQSPSKKPAQPTSAKARVKPQAQPSAKAPVAPAPVLAPAVEAPLLQPVLDPAPTAGAADATSALVAAPEIAPPPKKLPVPAPPSIMLRSDPSSGAPAEIEAPSVPGTAPPIVEQLPPATGPPAHAGASGGASTDALEGARSPLPPLPPPDPANSPTGLSAPGGGPGPQGAVGVIALITGFLLVFVPRIVRRLRPDGIVMPAGRFCVALERPG
jgi:hypothetical protein